MQPTITVSQFIEVINESLAMTYPTVDIVGEVDGIKEWNNRLVFFDLKDDKSTLSCMIQLNLVDKPIENGMQVLVTAYPRLSGKGRFSLVTRKLEPLGEGALSRAFELLRVKLENEGLFDASRKRALPDFPERIAVVTSLSSAAYRDFLQGIKNRWGGVEVVALNSQVQGEAAPEQLVSAIRYANQLADLPEVMVVTRGGGSLEDLAAFNSESVVRAIAGSRIPVVVAVGHETDTSLADLAADRRAMTPTDAATCVVPDRAQLQTSLASFRSSLQGAVFAHLQQQRSHLFSSVKTLQQAVPLTSYKVRLQHAAQLMQGQMKAAHKFEAERLNSLKRSLTDLDPEQVLKRGYAILRHKDSILRTIGAVSIGDRVVVQLAEGSLHTEVKDVQKN